MRYWWVNQNQTYHHEVQGGYLWSPKRNANGARNPFYESMREVAPGEFMSEAWIATVPTPGFAAMGVVGVAFTARRRRRF